MTGQSLKLPVPGDNAATRSLFAAWRAITLRRIVYTALLGLAWSGVEIASKLGYFVQAPSWSPAVNAILTMQFNGFAVMLAVMVADEASPALRRRWWPYVPAVAIGALAGSSLLWLVSQGLLRITTAYQQSGARDPFDTFVYRHFMHGFVVCGLGACVYVWQRFANQRLAALRAVQLKRAEREKHVLESRLAALQARVEPQFLRDTLARIEHLYEIDPAAADGMLRELTIYLRAALPDFRHPASTLARELRLTNAYVSIVGVKSAECVVADAAAKADAERLRMPPMILLPLINHALAQRVGQGDGAGRLRVAVATCGERLRLTISDEPAGLSARHADDPAIASIRERLAALFGQEATLTLRDDAAEAVLEMPLEVVPSTPPV